MTDVNPPPRLRIPPQLAQDRETRAYIEQLNTILFQLWTRTGGSTDVIDTDNSRVNGLENMTNVVFNSQVQQLIKRLDGLPEFTIDTTGFTTDTTFITTDKVTA